jgi:hypothetical protein
MSPGIEGLSIKRGQIYFLESVPFFRLSPQYFSIFLLQDVMRSDPAKEHPSCLKLKSEAVVHDHRTFPAIDCPGDLFNTKRWVRKIIEKKPKYPYTPPKGATSDPQLRLLDLQHCGYSLPRRLAETGAGEGNPGAGSLTFWLADRVTFARLAYGFA